MDPSIEYSKPIQGSKVQGNTHIYRKPARMEELTSYVDPQLDNLQKSFLSNVKKFGAKNCLGTQNKDQTEYNWKSYNQVKIEAEQIGSGLISLGLAPEICEYNNMKLRIIGVYAKNRQEWLILDIANTFYGATMVPLYDTLGPDTIQYVIGHSGMEVLFLEEKSFSNLWKSGDLHKLKYIVSMDIISEENKRIAHQNNIQLFTWNEVIEEGKKKIYPFYDVQPDDCFTFSYTSGTTGKPKAAMLSHKNILNIYSGAYNSDYKIQSTDVHLSYLPLAHIYERLIVVFLLATGGSIGFYGGNIMKITDDLAILKPTVFCSVPRILNKFYDQMYKAFGDDVDESKTKNFLGGNVRLINTGAAPISDKTLQYLRKAFGCTILEGYGQTESSGAGFVIQSIDTTAGHVGGPLDNMEFKLQDIPDMNYTSEDMENGLPAPRGEICIRGSSVFLGYYKDMEKTKETIDEEGWLHTGDVGIILPNGSLKIIDRKKNIFKLSQGEYISPEKIENVYKRDQSVDEIFVYGDTLQNYAIAIIVPNKQWVNTYAESQNIKEPCKEEGLKGFEQVKKIYLEEQSMSTYGCLTNTLKLKRHDAKQHFKTVINDLYGLGDASINK